MNTYSQKFADLITDWAAQAARRRAREESPSALAWPMGVDPPITDDDLREGFARLDERRRAALAILQELAQA